MITWVTVWVLTVTQERSGYREISESNYQLQYATQAICEKQRKNHSGATRCDFQQIPVVAK